MSNMERFEADLEAAQLLTTNTDGVAKDYRGQAIRQWNKVFLGACLVSLFVDPLFFLLPVVKEDACMDIGTNLETILSIIRSVVDMFYVIQIYVRFRIGYVALAPSSRVFGREELVIDSSKNALRYLRKGFWIDLLAALPLPQVFIWVIIPNIRGSTVIYTENTLWYILMIQYIPRVFVFLVFPLSSQIVDATGVVAQTSWARAAYNLMLCMLASHVLGACWYLLSVKRLEACWQSVCNLNCQHGFFDCRRIEDPRRIDWFKSNNVTNICGPNNNIYKFGIYGEAMQNDVTNTAFHKKYFYCLWWGLKNLSSLGRGLATTTYVGEILFSILVATLGLGLFGLLIANMLRYLQSSTIRLEEWRIKRTDMEQWMHHRQLPLELRESMRKYDQFQWLSTRGLNEEDLLNAFPMYLRREIKRHLYLDLVRKVPLIDKMDNAMLDAICEKLKPVFYPEGMFLVREGDPINQMYFIVRGHLDSYTTDGGRTGQFFNSCRIGPSVVCGEELLTWVLDQHQNVTFPSSTQCVKAISEVEAFALVAEDFKFVASQFSKRHCKQLAHIFRFYSHRCRTWAACVIQTAWGRHKKLNDAQRLAKAKSYEQKEKKKNKK